MSDQDAELMLKFKAGDKSAFEALLEKYHGPIINFIYRIISDRIEAEDLAQEAFLRVYRSAPAYKVTAKFSTWLYSIAKNLALNELRRKKTHRTGSLEEMAFDGEDGKRGKREIAGGGPQPVMELERRELAQTVAKAIDSLPPSQKVAVILRRYDELSYEDIARVIGCSVSAVKSLLNRAKESLKERLLPYIDEG